MAPLIQRACVRLPQHHRRDAQTRRVAHRPAAVEDAAYATDGIVEGSWVGTGKGKGPKTECSGGNRAGECVGKRGPWKGGDGPGSVHQRTVVAAEDLDGNEIRVQRYRAYETSTGMAMHDCDGLTKMTAGGRKLEAGQRGNVLCVGLRRDTSSERMPVRKKSSGMSMPLMAMSARDSGLDQARRVQVATEAPHAASLNTKTCPGGANPQDR
ncbi:hypothetical protein C8R44DRAFT_725924 [Mycena epipterygia]|nr:hypothetical protein C8R44DRAFT_725924 [Mycena epipterygia]